MQTFTEYLILETENCKKTCTDPNGQREQKENPYSRSRLISSFTDPKLVRKKTYLEYFGDLLKSTYVYKGHPENKPVLLPEGDVQSLSKTTNKTAPAGLPGITRGKSFLWQTTGPVHT